MARFTPSFTVSRRVPKIRLPKSQLRIDLGVNIKKRSPEKAASFLFETTPGGSKKDVLITSRYMTVSTGGGSRWLNTEPPVSERGRQLTLNQRLPPPVLTLECEKCFTSGPESCRMMAIERLPPFLPRDNFE
jgi:hypothetical protein